MSGPGGVRDRKVVLLMALVVVAILALDVVSGLVPGMDSLLAGAPVLVVLLLVGTVAVLAWSLLDRHPDG